MSSKKNLQKSKLQEGVHMKIYMILMLCVLFWSANFIIGRFIHNDVEPIELAFFRWMGVFMALSPMLLIHFKHIMRVIKKHFALMMVFSVLGITGFNTLLYIGLQDTTATNALLINSAVPIMIVFLAALILKQKITNNQIIGIILSTLGVILLVLKADLLKITALEFNKGDFWVISAGFSWALYSVLLKFKPKELKGMQFITAIVFLGTIVLLILYVSFGYGFTSGINHLDNHFMIILYLVFFPSILSYIFWHKGIETIGADKTGQFTHLMPLFGSLMAFVFLGETLELYHLLGMSFIAFGIYLSLFFKKKEKLI